MIVKPIPAPCCGCSCTACHSGDCCNRIYDGDDQPLNPYAKDE